MKHLSENWIFEDGKQRASRAAAKFYDKAEREAVRLPARFAALKFYISRLAHNLRGGR